MTNRKAIRRARRIRRTVLTVCLMALVAVLSIGGTIAYLTAQTKSVVNTFTVGNINITLTEEEGENVVTDANGNRTADFHMVPGNTIDKDPKVTVVGGSEACYLFVKVETSDNLDTYITWAIEDEEKGADDADAVDKWTLLSGTNNVYYREVDATETNIEFAVLEGNKVTVKDSVTKAQMNALEVDGATQPTLTFTAYAVQSDNVADAATAWTKVNP